MPLLRFSKVLFQPASLNLWRRFKWMNFWTKYRQLELEKRQPWRKSSCFSWMLIEIISQNFAKKLLKTQASVTSAVFAMWSRLYFIYRKFLLQMPSATICSTLPSALFFSYNFRPCLAHAKPPIQKQTHSRTHTHFHLPFIDLNYENTTKHAHINLNLKNEPNGIGSLVDL